MGEAFPELVREAADVQQVLRAEEERFAETLAAGHGTVRCAHGASPGAEWCRARWCSLLHDTYGFPPDLTADIARERGLEDRHARATSARWRRSASVRVPPAVSASICTPGPPVAERSEFRATKPIEGDARIVALLRDGQSVEALEAGERGEVLLDRTPFYAEAGGQVGDSGELRCAQRRCALRGRGHAQTRRGAYATSGAS